MINKKELKSITKNIYNKWNSLIFADKNETKQKNYIRFLSEYCIEMVTVYTRKEASEMLWISEQAIPKSNKVIQVECYSQRSKKMVKRYLLLRELKDVWLIKERVKKETW